jgi:hypothetical protein
MDELLKEAFQKTVIPQIKKAKAAKYCLVNKKWNLLSLSHLAK